MILSRVLHHFDHKNPFQRVLQASDHQDFFFDLFPNSSLAVLVYQETILLH